MAITDKELQEFGRKIDAIRDRIKGEIGDTDVEYIKRVDRFSRVAEALGRGLIHVSVEPVGFLSGVTLLWLHKQLQATEVGHTALHGTFDKLPNAERYHSQTFHWQTPIDEESWRYVHNQRHHSHTNIAGADPDIHFGPIRLTSHTPYKDHHRRQLGYTALLWSHFAFGINTQYTGMGDYLEGNGRDNEFDFIEARTPEVFRSVLRKFLRKPVRYYAKELALFPALAGPMFWKVLLGNWMTEVMRDVYSAATIFCGHVGEDTAEYPEGTKASSRAEWYKMQVEATNNFDVPLPISILCGALDHQIEHHLFPRFPTNRLREVAPEVRKACEEHGVEYRSASWPRTLVKALRRIRQLSRPDPVAPPVSDRAPALEQAA